MPQLPEVRKGKLASTIPKAEHQARSQNRFVFSFNDLRREAEAIIYLVAGSAGVWAALALASPFFQTVVPQTSPSQLPLLSICISTIRLKSTYRKLKRTQAPRVVKLAIAFGDNFLFALRLASGVISLSGKVIRRLRRRETRARDAPAERTKGQCIGVPDLPRLPVALEAPREELTQGN